MQSVCVFLKGADDLCYFGESFQFLSQYKLPPPQNKTSISH